MREILCDKGSVRGWYNRGMFAYTTNFGGISELGSDMNKLYAMPCLKMNLKKYFYFNKKGE